MIVPKHPPPNLLAPYPAIKALNQFGIICLFSSAVKKVMPLLKGFPANCIHFAKRVVAGFNNVAGCPRQTQSLADGWQDSERFVFACGETMRPTNTPLLFWKGGNISQMNPLYRPLQNPLPAKSRTARGRSAAGHKE